MSEDYARDEVVRLHSMTREQAIVSKITTDESRWLCVDHARRAVVRSKANLPPVELHPCRRCRRDLARLSDSERRALRGRWHASVDEILAGVSAHRAGASVGEAVCA